MLNRSPFFSIPLSFSSPFFPVDLRATYLSAERASDEQVIRKAVQLCYCYRRPLSFLLSTWPLRENSFVLCCRSSSYGGLFHISSLSLPLSLSLHLPTKVKKKRKLHLTFGRVLLARVPFFLPRAALAAEAGHFSSACRSPSFYFLCRSHFGLTGSCE